MAAPIVDQACFLQISGRLGNSLPPYAEHVGDQFLRHRQLTRAQSVQTQQQPATQLFVQRMMPIADGGLRHLRNQGLRVEQEQMLQRPALIKFMFD